MCKLTAVLLTSDVLFQQKLNYITRLLHSGATWSVIFFRVRTNPPSSVQRPMRDEFLRELSPSAGRAPLSRNPLAGPRAYRVLCSPEGT